MIPIRSDVTTLVLSLLGDTQVSGGQIFTAAFQAPHLNAAYQELFSRLSNCGADRVQREGYFLLPAYTGVFQPSVAGWSNFGGPVRIYERGNATAYAVSAATPATPAAGSLRLTVAALPASVVTGNQVDIYGVGGISDDVNDSWAITVNSTTSIDLNGCAATGTYSATTGKVIVATEAWSVELEPRTDTRAFPNPSTTNSSLSLYCWQRGVIKFPICSTAREIKVEYELSGTLPVVASPVAGDSMGVDDSLNFLANRTAQFCAASKGGKRGTSAKDLQAQANYFLGQLLMAAARQQQNEEPIVPAPFRYPRNNRTFVY